MKNSDPRASAPNSSNTTATSSEYEFAGETWTVTDFAKLASIFPALTPEQVSALHTLATSFPAEGENWMVIRKLCGIRPTVLPVEMDATKLGPFNEADAAAQFGMEAKDLPMLLHFLQLAWAHERATVELPVAPAPGTKRAKKPGATPAELPTPNVQLPTAANASATPAPITLTEEEMELLELGTFPTSIFEYHIAEYDRRAEIIWFTGRIEEVRKVFEEPMAKALTRLALLNELQLRRINDKLVTLDPTEKSFATLQEVKSEVEKTYGAQWEQIQQMCPYAVATANRTTTIAQMSDLVRLYQEHKSDPKNRLRDGIFTDDELQVQFRRSLQLPDVSYRLGWVIACNEAKVGISDPRFKRRMTDDQCKILDTGFQYAVRRLADKMNLPKPDLEADGPEGEYAPIHTDPTGDIATVNLEAITDAGDAVLETVAISEPGEVHVPTSELAAP